MPNLKSASALCALLMLVGCGGPPRGAYLSLEHYPEGVKPIVIHVATTRKRPEIEPSEMFSGERGKTVDYARLIVTIPPGHVPGEVEWAERTPVDPSKYFAVVSRRYGTGQEILASVQAELRKRAPADRDILVFVHGYNTSFDEALFRMAQIVTDSGFKGVPVLFSWPSRAKLLAYPYDRESVAFSRDDLEKALDVLAKSTGVRKIDIIAHSMGNMLTLETLRQAEIRGNGTFNGKLGQIMLAAPDVDVDVFTRQMEVILRRKHDVTIFFSKDDVALAASRRFWGGSPRIGAYDLSNPDYASKLERYGIRVVDLTALKTGDKLNHGKFASSPEVVQLIGAQLAATDMAEKASLGERLTTLGTNVGDSVGTAASLAISLPVTVIGTVTGAEAR
jgi:esterase/lipase superfamily enzyme